MKKSFCVSLLKNGIVGGSVVVGEDSIAYKTGKVQIPNFEIKFKDISKVNKGWFLILPMVTLTMRSGEECKFIVFFSRTKFIQALQDNGWRGAIE